MIPLSSRHLVPTALALWVLLIPVAYHGLVRPQADDCAAPAALAIERFAPASERVRARPAPPPRKGRQRHGELVTRRRWQGDPLWNLVRSYDLGESYILPPGRLSFSSSLEESSLLLREVAGTPVPVHRRVERFGGFANVGVHLYLLGGRPVRTPLLASLRLAWPQLLHGTLPLTTIVAEGDVRETLAPTLEELLVEWLLAAWAEYDAVCRP